MYLRLSRMALDYLTIPGALSYYILWLIRLRTCLSATSVAVERVFSRGRILLSHLRNRLSAQTVRALLCLGEWSRLNLIDDNDVRVATSVPEDESEETMEEWGSGWDRIVIDNE